MYPVVGSEEAVHPGSLCGCAAGGGAVFKWIINRWVRCRRVSEQLLITLQLPLFVYVTACAVSPSGLSIGDRPGSQPLGIILTIVGVVVLDFCADASEGPIRAYLLDVADTEEQDMALNIHAFSAGKTPSLRQANLLVKASGSRSCCFFLGSSAMAAHQKLLTLLHHFPAHSLPILQCSHIGCLQL